MNLTVINLAEFIFESDLIEGIRNDPDQLIRQIQNKKQDGHVGAMLALKELAGMPPNVGSRLTKNLICNIQGLITSEQHEKKGGERLDPQFVGRYRPDNIAVSVGDRLCMSSCLVPVKMEELIKKINSWQVHARFHDRNFSICAIADFHFRFEIIHPFADGNGRTGRALVYFLLRQAGLEPFVFTNSDKHDLYYPCFNDSNDSRLMRTYFFLKIDQDSHVV